MLYLITTIMKSQQRCSLICEIKHYRERITYMPLKGFLHSALKMSHDRLLSQDRKLFVWKVYHEMENNAILNTPDRENQKAYFLQLVKGNKKLSEIEK